MFHIGMAKGGPPLPEGLSPECRDFLNLCFNRSECCIAALIPSANTAQAITCRAFKLN